MPQDLALPEPEDRADRLVLQHEGIRKGVAEGAGLDLAALRRGPVAAQPVPIFENQTCARVLHPVPISPSVSPWSDHPSEDDAEPFERRTNQSLGRALTHSPCRLATPC